MNTLTTPMIIKTVLLLIFWILSIVLWEITLAILIKNDKRRNKIKMLWLIAIAGVPTVGSILYLTVGKEK